MMLAYRWWMVVCLFVALPLFAAERGPGPFTHEPRSGRSRDIDQQHVRLDLDFDFAEQRVKGRALHRFTLFRPVTSLTLDAADMKIEQVSLANPVATGEPDFKPTKFQHQGDKLYLDLPAQDPSAERWLAIDYTISKPKHGAHFVHPDANEPGSLTMVWTQSEPEFARYWYPCFDHPSDRLTSEIVATVPAPFTVVSNGVLKEKKDVGNGRMRWHWSQTQSHVPYLLSVVAGEFEALEQEWESIPVISYVPKGRLGDARHCFEKTPAMMKFFSQKLDFRYPWPKYAQICVDEYAWGGMEHTSATTLNLNSLHGSRAHADEFYGTDSLVAHELAHQWFGDLVTCKDWSELWLNESFATYFATLWTEHDLGWHESVWDRRGDSESYFSEDQRYRRAIVNDRYDRPDVMFDSHTYPKGGRVLHMLRFELGDELFWKSLHHYLEVNKYRTVETADLRRAIEEVSGQSLNWFFRQWLDRGGHPEFNVSWTYDEAAKSVAVTVQQTQTVDALTSLFRTSAEIEVATSDETKLQRVTITKANETFHFPCAKRPTRVLFDPRDWLLDKTTANLSKHEQLDILERCEHILPRYQAVQSFADKKDDAEILAALKKAAKEDKFWAVRQEAVKVLGNASGDETRKLLIDIAKSDPRVEVRRETVQALHRFNHDETKVALREIIAKESSYKTVAEALRSLVKIDGPKSIEDLRQAMKIPSHGEVVFQAAADGLIDLKDAEAPKLWQAMLGEKLTADLRAAVIRAIARAKPEDNASMELLKAQLDHRRPNLRREAVNALVEIGDARGIGWLQEHRGKETSPRTLQQVDEAIEKIRGREKQNAPWQKQAEELRTRNRQLEERIQKLEKD